MSGEMILQGVCTLFYAIEVAVLLWVVQSPYKEKYYVTVKMICSCSFVAIGLIFAVVSEHWTYFYQLLPALALCALGDFFMGCYNVRRQIRNLILGIVSFLLAHVCLLFMLYQVEPAFTWWNAIFPVVGVLSLIVQKKVLHMNFGKSWIAVLCYSMFLTLMLAKAIEIMVTKPCISSAWIGVGGILFFISDYSLSFCYFYEIKNKKRAFAVNAINLISYFFGILAFDISILYFIR